MVSIQACPSYHPSSLAIYLNIWCCGRRETTSGNRCTECNAYLKLKHSGQSVWQDHLTLPFPQLWEHLWCTTGSIWFLLRLHLTWHVDHSVLHPRVVPCVLDMGLQSLPGTPTALWLVVESESSAPMSCTGRGEGKQWGSDHVLLCPPSLSTPSGCLEQTWKLPAAADHKTRVPHIILHLEKVSGLHPDNIFSPPLFMTLLGQASESLATSLLSLLFLLTTQFARDLYWQRELPAEMSQRWVVLFGTL